MNEQTEQAGSRPGILVLIWLFVWTGALALMSVSFLLTGCGESSEPPQLTPAVSSPVASPTATIPTGFAPENRTTKSSELVSVGDLEGVILYGGTAAKPALLVRGGDKSVKDFEVCGGHDILDESLLVDGTADNGLANVFVFLGRAPEGHKTPVPVASVVFDQRECVFVPRNLIVRVGQPVLVKSNDAIAHNVHTLPVRNHSTNVSIAANNRDGLQLTYSMAERKPLLVKCDLHPWMRAWHLPLDHSFAAVTARDGTFRIRELPAGTHRLRIWHERAGFLERSREITIRAGQIERLEITYPAERFSARGEGKPATGSPASQR
ncbi:MAG: hypothetical protein CMJ65_11295 [Planctomycetaceae bacterium]|nr:hypothetical protein [Planctomycetaceae bacterium]